jgi:hypothetical protein
MNVFLQIDALYHMQNDMQIKKAPAEAGEGIISQEDALVQPPAIRQGLSARKERQPLRQQIEQKSSLPQGCRLNHRIAYRQQFEQLFSRREFLRL